MRRMYETVGYIDSTRVHVMGYNKLVELFYLGIMLSKHSALLARSRKSCHRLICLYKARESLCRLGYQNPCTPLPGPSLCLHLSQSRPPKTACRSSPSSGPGIIRAPPTFSAAPKERITSSTSSLATFLPISALVSIVEMKLSIPEV